MLALVTTCLYVSILWQLNWNNRVFTLMIYEGRECGVCSILLDAKCSEHDEIFQVI